MAVAALRAGSSASAQHVVTAADTARALGSGDLEVLATPRLLAWMEAATCAAVAADIAAGQTTVGVEVSLEHLRASGVGAVVDVVATLAHVDGRLIRFEVVAEHDAQLCARAEITRVVVDRERFLDRVAD